MNKKEESTFGSRVKEIRIRLKMNQTEFGKGIGLSLPHISAIERDSTKPGHTFFYNIVKKYGVNLNYLLFNEGEMFLGEEKKGEGFSGEIRTGNLENDEFLHYFFNSELARYHMLYDFRKLMGEDGASIKRSMKKPWDPEKESENERNRKSF